MSRWFKYWRVFVALVTVFLAGGLMGFIGGATAAKRKIQQLNRPENWSGLMMQKLNHELRLSDEQRDKVEPLLQATARDLFAIRRQATVSSIQHLRTLYTSLEPVLTEEQKKKLEQAKEKMRQQFKEGGEIRPFAPGGPVLRHATLSPEPPGKAGGEPGKPNE